MRIGFLPQNRLDSILQRSALCRLARAPFFKFLASPNPILAPVSKGSLMTYSKNDKRQAYRQQKRELGNIIVRNTCGREFVLLLLLRSC
jgi:hypothetical protein